MGQHVLRDVNAEDPSRWPDGIGKFGQDMAGPEADFQNLLSWGSSEQPQAGFTHGTLGMLRQEVIDLGDLVVERLCLALGLQDPQDARFIVKRHFIRHDIAPRSTRYRRPVSIQVALPCPHDNSRNLDSAV